MDEKTLNKIWENRTSLVPTIFTDKQVEVISKHLHHKKMTNSEKTYLYSTIKKKVEALHSLQEEFYITGESMIPERVETAKNILKEINYEKAFISGSFLYKQKYNDIDIYVLNKNRKSYNKEERHFTFITEKDLHKPLFVSVAKYSVANFSPITNLKFKRNSFDEIMFIYQWVINQLLENEDQKELRNLVFEYGLRIENCVLDARSLDMRVQKIKSLPKDKRIEEINRLTRMVLLKSFSKTYTYIAISKFIKSVKEMAKEYHTENIPIFLDFAKGVQHECRRAEA